MELPTWVIVCVVLGIFCLIMSIFGEHLSKPIEYLPPTTKKNNPANLELAKALGWTWDEWLYAWVKGGRAICYTKDLPDFHGDVNLIRREVESLGLHWWIGKLGPGNYQAWVGETDPRAGATLTGNHPALALCSAALTHLSEPSNAKSVPTRKRGRKAH
jgi:hypothetical protein